MIAIELPIAEPLPEGCSCNWAYDAKRGIKYIKHFHANCDVAAHVTAYRSSLGEIPSTVDIPVVKRGRGRPRNEAGQWHKNKTA